MTSCRVGEKTLSFRDIEIKTEYRSFRDDIVRDFYIPLLKHSCKYQRAVGFFSSTALIEISEGICELVKNGGSIELIASPKLSEEDIEAIEKGIKLREEVIEDRINTSIFEPKNEYEEERLNLLVNLIANNILEIKIAVIDKDNSIGMFHEKLGLLYDNDGNVIAFSGSMNESTMAFAHNYESIDVFKSWEFDKLRVESKIKAFEAIWEDEEPNIRTLDFPEASRQKLFKYRKNDIIDLDLDKKAFCKEDIPESSIIMPPKKLKPELPSNISLRDYQVEAIDEWQKRNFVGIFDMATGTGKTITGLSAVVRLYESLKSGLAIFIVCPYQHLVNQWVEDIENFGMQPIICHSASTQRNWKSRLSDACLSLELGIEDHFCAIFTNATYASSYVQDTIKPILKKSLILVDEAHNFGAENLSKFLNKDIPYRLALSATIERYGDEEGTEKLFNYFGDKCIEYTLEEAIRNDMLTRYYYYPIPVSFQEEELSEYVEISKKIAKTFAINKKKKLSEHTKMLLIKRARMVAAASEKVSALCNEMLNHKDDAHMLVYCGATTMRDEGYMEGVAPEEEKRQIDLVAEKLGNELGMKVAKFTSEENAEEREILKKEFDEGESLQVLIAIRCLDEGVNIPNIRKAFILASSTNPKEYIQRRGRVLRKAKGKEYAAIYDFIMVPIPLEDLVLYDDDVIKSTQSLVRKEIERMKDFANLAENPSVADDLIFQLANSYNIDLTKEVDEFDY